MENQKWEVLVGSGNDFEHVESFESRGAAEAKWGKFSTTYHPGRDEQVVALAYWPNQDSCNDKGYAKYTRDEPVLTANKWFGKK